MQASLWTVFEKKWTFVFAKRLCFNHSWIRFLRNVASPFHILSTGLGKKHYLVFESDIWNVPTENSPFRFCNKSWNLFHELRKDFNQNSCLQGACLKCITIFTRDGYLGENVFFGEEEAARQFQVLGINQSSYSEHCHHVKSSSPGANKSISPSKA